VHPRAKAVALAPDGDRVIEVLRGLRVDRERELLPEVDSALEAGRRRIVRLVLGPDALMLEQRLEDVLDPLGGPERLLEAGATPPGGDDRQVAWTDVAESPLVQRDRDAGSEERLADDESPAPSDLDDDAIGRG
jgi:hypothetical protein